MIDCIFTLDYEIYGNGTGALRDLVYEPAERLREIFGKRNARFVAFVEVAELERIEALKTDPAIDLVKRQIRELDGEGFEIGLHLHPQWMNARLERGRWVLDAAEYNLCTLPRERIGEIVRHSLDYLRYVLGRSQFTPLAFRAGNWLFQPTTPAAEILAQHGIKMDSSVFKGGVQHNYHLDYRRASKNGYYWTFSSNATEEDPKGELIELPIYAELVPFWRMLTSKRLGFSNGSGLTRPSRQHKLNRLRDFVRFRYPLKFDFCRMTLSELRSMIDRAIQADQKSPESYKPLVAIGHTKDFTDSETVEAFLAVLDAKGIPVSTFETAYSKLNQCVASAAN
ncbi:MAG: hypothetical protein ACRD2B_00580 [Terriglobia bacterium]